MATGKLSISRGNRHAPDPGPAGPRLTVVPRAEVAMPVDAPACDPRLVELRLAALERLARLRAEGILSDAELAAEKAVVLAMPVDELVLHEALPAPPGPSLLGRLLGWKLVPIGLFAGLAFSFVTQPAETLRAIDDLVVALGF